MSGSDGGVPGSVVPGPEAKAAKTAKDAQEARTAPPVSYLDAAVHAVEKKHSQVAQAFRPKHF